MERYTDPIEVQTPNEPLCPKARVILEAATHGEMMHDMKEHCRVCDVCRIPFGQSRKAA